MNFSRIFFAALLGCLSCGTPPPPVHEHGGSDAGLEQPYDAGLLPVVDAGSADAGTTDAGPVLPGVPVLVSVSSNGHEMAISWQLPASGCGAVGLWMKSTGGYSKVTSLSGVTSSTTWSTGHGSGTFCFQVSCTLGGVESAASNEKCATQ